MNKNINKKKIFAFGLSTTILCLAILLPIFVSAATGGTIVYQPLAPIPALGIGSSMTLGGNTALVVYFNSIVKIMVSLATGLAVLYIVWGGVQYAMTDSFAAKGEGKKTITRALQGLLLALTSWLILNTINPAILTGTINGLRPVGSGPVGGGAQGAQDPGIQVIPPGTTSGGTTGAVDVATGQLNNGILSSASYAQLVNYNGQTYTGGKGSTFGGPNDPDGGLGYQDLALVPGVRAVDLDVNSYYLAGRWDYSQTPVSELRNATFVVTNPKTGATETIKSGFNSAGSPVGAVDYGPALSTGKTWDLSPGLARQLGIQTGDEVLVQMYK